VRPFVDLKEYMPLNHDHAAGGIDFAPVHIIDFLK
jgi:hypothetical protein